MTLIRSDSTLAGSRRPAPAARRRPLPGRGGDRGPRPGRRAPKPAEARTRGSRGEAAGKPAGLLRYTRAMSVKPIVLLGDPRLRLKGEPVDSFGKYLHELLDDLAHTMRHAPGVGLAAPQLGEAMRACVIEVENQLYELVNPKIVRTDRRRPRPRGLPVDPGLRRLRHPPREGLGRGPEPAWARRSRSPGRDSSAGPSSTSSTTSTASSTSTTSSRWTSSSRSARATTRTATPPIREATHALA